MKIIRYALAFASALTLASPVLAQTPGVTKNELVIGSIQDLSGPIAVLGKWDRDGLQMRVDEANAAGGINGRKIVFKVEDSGYDPRRGVLAAQKLVNEDHVFAMVGNLGTPVNMATFPVIFKKNVINFFPLSSAREMFEPPNQNLKFSFAVPYYDQVRVGMVRLMKEKNAKRACIIYQDDDFGAEVLRGAEAGIKTLGLNLIEKTSFKRGATDFSSQVAKMKAANCDFVVMGTVIRETVGTIAEARKTDFNPTFMGTSASYSRMIPQLGGKAMDGFYSTMMVGIPYVDEGTPESKAWAQKYKAKFNEDPDVFSVYSYEIMNDFLEGVRRAGADLTTESFIKAMESAPIPADIFGGDTQTFTPTKRLGSDRMRMSQIKNGRWEAVSGYFN